MKIVRNIFVLAACMAVSLLSSCTKEEVRVATPCNLQVTLSLPDAGSTKAGESIFANSEKIEDITVWAFEMSHGRPIDMPALGFATYTVPENASSLDNITLNIPTKIFKETAEYRFVAVLNKHNLGLLRKANGIPFVLNENTSYYDLIGATFHNYLLTSYNLTENTPAIPFSHWKDEEITVYSNPDGTKTVEVKGTTDNKVNIPVYRTLARTQLFFKPKSDFELKVTGAVLVDRGSVNGQGGMLLAKNWEEGFSDWWIEDAIVVSSGSSSMTYPLPKESYVVCNNPDDFTFVGAQLMFEHPYAIPADAVGNEFFVEPGIDDLGYFLKLDYEIGGTAMPTRYIPYPVVYRNHDYRINVTVKENAEIRVEYDVADWNQEIWELDFSSPQHTNLLPVPDESLNTKQGVPTVSYTAGTEAGAAVFYFKVKGPAGITWKPTLLNASSKDYEVRVYRVIENTDPQNPTLSKENITTAIDANTDYFYAVKVVAVNSSTVGRVKPVNLAISYDSKYSVGNTSLLVVNPNGFWAVPDGCTQDRFCVQIKHVQQ